MRGLDIYLSRLGALRATGRIEELHRYYPFAALDYSCCVILNSESDKDEHLQLADRFEVHELGWPSDKRGPGYRRRLAARLVGIARELIGLVRARRLEVVTAYDPHMLGAFGALVAAACRIPLRLRIVRDHVFDYEHFGKLALPPLRSRRLERALERFVFRRAAQVLVQSPNHARMVRSSGVHDDRIYPYVYAQDPYFYEDREPPPLPAEHAYVRSGPSVVTVSRLVPEKFVDDLIPLACRCAGRIPNVRFVVLGDGPLRERMGATIAAERLPIVLAGTYAKEKVAAFLRAAACVFIPQGAGIVTEAALLGANIVTYDLDMNPFVVGRDYPFLVPPRDVERAAEAVVAAVCERATEARLGARLRADARHRFGIPLALEAERLALRSLAAGRRDGAAVRRAIWGPEHA